MMMEGEREGCEEWGGLSFNRWMNGWLEAPIINMGKKNTEGPSRRKNAHYKE
jgi:hypothetical protein